MIGSLYSTVLDSPDIKGSAAFYAELAGLSEHYADDNWVTLLTKEGWRVCFQRADDHVSPRWPDPAAPQQFHLDFRFPDMAAGVERAIELGATRLPGGGETWTVLADPAGHPFCVCQGEPGSEIQLADVAIDCPDAAALAGFYSELLGLPVTWEGEGGGAIGADGKLSVIFQQVETYNPPQWPDAAHPQQYHLDVKVTDIEEAEPKALALGATKLPGGGEDFRVYADPAGHPFCLIW
ncbi:catechol-2,3-dioxygenase [Allocatelliglobosispora scoriae]|uniref:Catechol-2,3-dioxygenase n=1 Tax=Allocatelliglobosispora scoriae TaxID=643052 RepID=A0A841BZV3_9ACTN|nr:VOC family protein [Allocatelliglobosispora scoriae]MBB5873028.1 catechol-2,3-dioxygenase [Allocatelliglobosispora scoriae]